MLAIAGFFAEAFAHPVTLGIFIGVAALLVVTPVIIAVLRAVGRIDDDLRLELFTRYRSWLILAPAMCIPVLLGRLFTIAAIGLLSLLCYREFARATGLFRHRAISSIVVLGILMLTFAAADHWYALFVALTPLVITAIIIVAVLADQPQGYIQRVALAVFAFLLFGVCLGHLAYFANDGLFRPIILMVILCVELNDIFAYVAGKTLGSRRLCTNTSPNKTVAGALGALLATTGVFAWLAHVVFVETIIDHPLHLMTMGVIVSIAGQFGDLVLSSIKRDLGVKDMAAAIPGHGGLLDRFDSLLLVTPALFHYIAYYRGVGLDQPMRVLTSS